MMQLRRENAGSLLLKGVLKHRVKEIIGRSRGISMENKIHELTLYIRGWIEMHYQ